MCPCTRSFKRAWMSFLLRLAMIRRLYHAWLFQCCANQVHRAPKTAERVLQELDPFGYASFLDEARELGGSEPGLLEEPLRLEQERLDPAHREGALAQVVIEEEDHVGEIRAIGEGP